MSADESSSVVVGLYTPPMSTRPAGDIQLEWPDLTWRSLLDSTHPPARAESLTQEVLPPTPPQLSSPLCVCPYRVVGRGGSEAQRRVPEADNTSTEVRLDPSYPPVISITEILNYLLAFPQLT